MKENKIEDIIGTILMQVSEDVQNVGYGDFENFYGDFIDEHVTIPRPNEYSGIAYCLIGLHIVDLDTMHNINEDKLGEYIDDLHIEDLTSLYYYYVWFHLKNPKELGDGEYIKTDDELLLRRHLVTSIKNHIRLRIEYEETILTALMVQIPLDKWLALYGYDLNELEKMKAASDETDEEAIEEIENYASDFNEKIDSINSFLGFKRFQEV